MPQIFIILGTETMALFAPDEVWALGRELIPLVEEGFDIKGKNDVAFTAVGAVADDNEAAVQIEIRYTAGKNEYDRGRPFDPDEETQRTVARLIRGKTFAFFRVKGLPKYSVSVWVKPYYKGVFVDG